MKSKNMNKIVALFLSAVLALSLCFSTVSFAADEKVVEIWARNPNLSWGVDQRVLAMAAFAQSGMLTTYRLDKLSTDMGKNIYLAFAGAQNAFVISLDTNNVFDINGVTVYAELNDMTDGHSSYYDDSRKLYIKEISEYTSSNGQSYYLIKGGSQYTALKATKYYTPEDYSYYIMRNGNKITFEEKDDVSISGEYFYLSRNDASVNLPVSGNFPDGRTLKLKIQNEHASNVSHEGLFIVGNGDENLAIINSGTDFLPATNGGVTIIAEENRFSSAENKIITLPLNDSKFVVFGMSVNSGTGHQYRVRDLGFLEFVKIGEYLISSDSIENYDPNIKNINLGIIEVIPDKDSSSVYSNNYELGYGIGEYKTGTFRALKASSAAANGSAVISMEAALRSSANKLITVEDFETDKSKVKITYSPKFFYQYSVPKDQWFCSFETTKGYIVHFTLKVMTDPLSDLKAQVNTNKTDIANLKTTVENNTKNILSNTTAITDLQNKFEQSSTNITDIETQVNKNKTDISSLKTRVDAIDKIAKTINLGEINICNDADGRTKTYVYQFGFNLGSATYANTATTVGGIRYRIKTSTTASTYDTLTLEVYIADSSIVSAGKKKIAFASAGKTTGGGFKVYATLNVAAPPSYAGTTNVVF